MQNFSFAFIWSQNSKCVIVPRFVFRKVCSFEVTEEYIDGLSSLFGTFDEDSSGGVELAEFRAMFKSLGLEQHTELLLRA